MKFFIMFLLLFKSLAFGHGENKPGPHKGHIRMPGNFHTEVVRGHHGFQVYLLDMAFKNPTIKDSSVAIKATKHGKTIAGHCIEKEDHFECHLPGDLSKYTKLSVKSVRKGQKGKEAFYPLPLKFKGKAPEPVEDHSHHNHH